MTEYYDGFDTKSVGYAIAKVRSGMKPMVTTEALAKAAEVDLATMKRFEMEGTGLTIEQVQKTLPLLKCDTFADLMDKARDFPDLPPSVINDWRREIELAHIRRARRAAPKPQAVPDIPLAVEIKDAGNRPSRLRKILDGGLIKQADFPVAPDAPPAAEIKYADKGPSRLSKILDGGLIKQADFPGEATETQKADEPRGRE